MSLKDGDISSNMKGVPISFTVKELGEALGIPYTGAEIRANHNANLHGYDKRELYFGIARISEREFLQKRKKIVGGEDQDNRDDDMNQD
ncbi:hypothetical protein KIW84_043248 [Lathyrus oleraceus]|uniref:Uncharacterized protein n=1 Tax=Pisum sativum TaxID=3888 RepID=A0A9D5ATR2_PEA|nr:hypothetical protein KIW84_043248 [Pisum sativum]